MLNFQKGHPKAHEIISAFEYWSSENCSEKAYQVLLTQALQNSSVDGKSTLQEFQMFYAELFRMANFQKFNEEQFNITGLTFRRLVQESVKF